MDLFRQLASGLECIDDLSSSVAECLIHLRLLTYPNNTVPQKIIRFKQCGCMPCSSIHEVKIACLNVGGK